MNMEPQNGGLDVDFQGCKVRLAEVGLRIIGPFNGRANEPV